MPAIIAERHAPTFANPPEARLHFVFVYRVLDRDGGKNIKDELSIVENMPFDEDFSWRVQLLVAHAFQRLGAIECEIRLMLEVCEIYILHGFAR